AGMDVVRLAVAKNEQLLQNVRVKLQTAIKVWVPIISIGERALAWTLQRLPDLLPATADHESKLRESQTVADTLAVKMLQSDDKAATMSKLPKTIGKLRQQKLAAREHLKAVLHVVSLLELHLQPPTPLLRPVNPQQLERREYYDGRAYITDERTGAAIWNDIPVEQAPSLVRLVLCPDEGSPLYSGYQFLAQRGLPLALLRDELQLGIHQKCSSRRQGPIHDKKRWCAWSFNADGFQKKYSSTLLLVMWSSIEEGKNPFFVEKKDEEGKKGDFDRILELCVKEPGSARQRSTSSHDMSGIRPGSGG
ncbi:unnamed protein product, partial [Symbiodinium sp. CCMP2456]